MNKTQYAAAVQEAQDLQAAIETLESEIARYAADAREVQVRIAHLNHQLAQTDDDMRGAYVSDRVRQHRARINAEIARERRSLQTIEEEAITPRQTRAFSLRQDLAGVTKSLITEDDMQGAVDSASAALAALVATRPGAVQRLKAAQDKHDEVQALLQAEADAAEELETLRADVFLLPANSPKRDAADEAVGNADMALAVAREKAATARAALPRVLASIEQHSASLAEIDSRISEARQAVADRERERNVWTGQREFRAAIDSLGDAIKMIEEADEDRGFDIRRTLEEKGLYTLDQHGHLTDRPRWLRAGFTTL